MPRMEALERFIAAVEANDHVGAIEAFYAPDASMQENALPPRRSREALVAHERKFLSRLRSLHSRCVRPVFVNGDCVVIRWIFEFEFLDGTRRRLEELAYQQWKGDLIIAEKFFYDPGELRAGA